MTVSPLNRDTEVLLGLYSQLPSPQLAIAVTQHPGLSDHVASALQQLAASSISEPTSIVSKDVQRQSDIIADLVRKLISRGDPSLVRKLLPNQSSLIDFALCTNAKDLLARLVDETEAVNYIRAASLAFERALKATDGSKIEQANRIAKAAKILTCVVSIMPSRKVVEEKLTRGQQERGSEESELICSTVATIRSAYESLKVGKGPEDRQDLIVLHAKVSVLDAAWYLIERFLLYVAKATKRSSPQEVDELLEVLCGSGALKQGGTPLVDLPLAVDVALVRPLQSTIKSGYRQYSSAHLEAIGDQLKRCGYATGKEQIISNLGPAWSRLISSASSQSSREQVPKSLIESVLAVLPYYEENRLELETCLASSKYAGKDAETVIQLLLEDDDDFGAEEGGDAGIDPGAFEDVEALRIPQERANVFDNQELEGAKVTRGKAREAEVDRMQLSSGLSADIRAAILARAEEPDSDKEEEWNSFSEAAFEVGFEEEMEEEMSVVGKPAIGRSPDEQDEEDEDDELEEGEADGDRGASGHGAGPRESNNVGSERAAERILISTWSDRGEAIFSKEARKSAVRAELRTKLNDLPGRRWDDGLIESWATMFARNLSAPRKDKLLASVDDIMRLGNQNIATGPDSASGQSNYGPDKGRGGRVMTGKRGGQGGRGRGGGRGSARGGRGNRGARRRGGGGRGA